MNAENIIALLLEDSEVQQEIKLQLEYICEDILQSDDFKKLIAEKLKLPPDNKPQILISTREAAKRLGYHPKYLLRKAKKLGLTKVYLSSKSVRFDESEVELLIEKNSLA